MLADGKAVARKKEVWSNQLQRSSLRLDREGFGVLRWNFGGAFLTYAVCGGMSVV